MHLRRHLNIWLLPLLLATDCVRAQQEEPQQVNLYMGSVTEGRIEHETQLVRMALEKSREKYGDYELEVHMAVYSRSRALRNFRSGEIINAVTSPELTFQNDPEDSPLITIDIPLLKGLLGKRRAIVRLEQREEFAEIDSIEQLRRKNAGLGFDWVDRRFFENNQLPFTTGTDIAQLFNMLAHGRFDYLPLGLIEAEKSLERSGFADRLTIVENLVIHYPLPVYLQVSANKPELAERLQYGLEIAGEDGSLDELFRRHYGQITDALDSVHTIELTPP